MYADERALAHAPMLARGTHAHASTHTRMTCFVVQRAIAGP